MTARQSVAYKKGVQACKEGKSIEANPYSDNNRNLYDYWRMGFTDQMEHDIGGEW